ncbi:hypothetical protein BH20ACT15_BH20ACT15_12660 [soil metagenome]
MATKSPRATWTDERLDGFRNEVLARFDGVDQRFDGVDQRFDRVDQRLDRVERGLDRVDGRIDELHRTLFIVGGGIAASILVSAAGIVATQL